MEKVVVVSAVYSMDDSDVEEVNEYLEQGWTVKSVTAVSHEEHLVSIFVLEHAERPEKEKEPDKFDGSDEPDGPGWKRLGKW